METAIDISLLLPTRARPQLLTRLFDSLSATTAALDRLEIVLYVDEDDTPTQEVSYPSLRVIKKIGPRKQTMGQMNQDCYDASHGRLVMLMNDDVVFRTAGWDRRLVESFSQFPEPIALVYGNDLYQRQALPTMPVLSRYCCELIGGICPRTYRNTYIDLHLFDLFKKLAKLGHSRLIYHDDLIFEHLHHETGKAALDSTYVKTKEQDDDRLFINLEDERWRHAKLLKQQIESAPGFASAASSKRGIGAFFKNMFSAGKGAR